MTETTGTFWIITSLFTYSGTLSPQFLLHWLGQKSPLTKVAKAVLLRTCIPGVKGKGKVHPCTGTDTLYRPYGPQAE
jgi:hypothetical protein